MRTNQFVYLILGVSLIALTSCTLSRTNAKQRDRTIDKIEAVLQEPHPPENMYKLDTISVKDDIWLGNQSVRVNEGDPLPARFETQEGITLVSTTPVSLLQISEQITSLTGITVRVDDMILNEVINATQGKEGEGLGATTNTNTDLFMPAYSGKLSGLLDQIVSRFALWWRYRNGVITFYKMETRVFTVYALPVTSNLNANIAGTASGEGGGTTSASMDSSISLDFWTQLENAVTSMLPEGATLNVIPSNGTMTVTAPPFTLQRIAQYVNGMNEKLSRQVAISVKVMNVTLNKDQTMGFDVSSAIRFINSKTGHGFTLAGKSSGELFTDSSSGLNMGIIPGGGHFQDSTIFMQALSSQGDTSLVTSASVTTMNNKIAPIQVSTNQSYVEKIETTMNSDTYSTSITPAKINYGFTMEILPRILDHGRLLLMFTMTLTDLERMDEATGGGTEATTTVQLPIIKTRGFVQEVAMTSGSTLILSGFEEVRTQTDKTKEIMAYKDVSSNDRNVMVILLTPEVLVSPLSPETRMRGV